MPYLINSSNRINYYSVWELTTKENNVNQIFISLKECSPLNEFARLLIFRLWSSLEILNFCLTGNSFYCHLVSLNLTDVWNPTHAWGLMAIFWPYFHTSCSVWSLSSFIEELAPCYFDEPSGSRDPCCQIWYDFTFFCCYSNCGDAFQAVFVQDFLRVCCQLRSIYQGAFDFPYEYLLSAYFWPLFSFFQASGGKFVDLAILYFFSQWENMTAECCEPCQDAVGSFSPPWIYRSPLISSVDWTSNNYIYH